MRNKKKPSLFKFTDEGLRLPSAGHSNRPRLVPYSKFEMRLKNLGSKEAAICLQFKDINDVELYLSAKWHREQSLLYPSYPIPAGIVSGDTIEFNLENEGVSKELAVEYLNRFEELKIKLEKPRVHPFVGADTQDPLQLAKAIEYFFSEGDLLESNLRNKEWQAASERIQILADLGKYFDTDPENEIPEFVFFAERLFLCFVTLMSVERRYSEVLQNFDFYPSSKLDHNPRFISYGSQLFVNSADRNWLDSYRFCILLSRTHVLAKGHVATRNLVNHCFKELARSIFPSAGTEVTREMKITALFEWLEFAQNDWGNLCKEDYILPKSFFEAWGINPEELKRYPDPEWSQSWRHEYFTFKSNFSHLSLFKDRKDKTNTVLQISQEPDLETESEPNSIPWTAGKAHEYANFRGRAFIRDSQRLIKIPVPGLHGICVHFYLEDGPFTSSWLFVIDSRGQRDEKIPIALYFEDRNYGWDHRGKGYSVTKRRVCRSEFVCSSIFDGKLSQNIGLEFEDYKGWKKLYAEDSNSYTIYNSMYHGNNSHTLLINPDTLEVRFISRRKLNTSD